MHINTTIGGDAKSPNNAILVRERDGRAVTECCRAEDGQAIIDKSLAQGSGGTLFMFDDGAFEAEFYLKYSNVKARVDAAMHKLNADLRMRDAMNAAGVPDDPELRKKVFKAMEIHAAVCSGSPTSRSGAMAVASQH